MYDIVLIDLYSRGRRAKRFIVFKYDKNIIQIYLALAME